MENIEPCDKCGKLTAEKDSCASDDCSQRLCVSCYEEPQQDPVVDKSLEKRATAYSVKYNTMGGRDYDHPDYEAESEKYSCDGCSQNVDALKHAYIAGAKESKSTAIADFILLLRERCEDHVCHSEGRLVNHDNPDDAWGEQMTANDLLKYAEELKLKMEGK